MMKLTKAFLWFLALFLISHSLFAQNHDREPFSQNSIHNLAKTDYQWISYQGSFTFDDEEDTPLSAQFYFVNRIDSIIYLNIHISGIELGRAVFTPDTMVFVNKTNKTFYRGDYTLLSATMNGISLNFSILQSLFNGLDFNYDNSDCIVMEDSTGITITANDRVIGDDSIKIYQKILLNNSHKIINNYLEIPEIMEIINIAYRRYEEEGEKTIFHTIEVETSSIHFTAEMKNIKINIPGTTAIRIPNSFTPIQIQTE